MSADSISNMGPVNAAVRFVCEIAAVYGIAAGVWTWTDSVPATVFSVIVVLHYATTRPRLRFLLSSHR